MEQSQIIQATLSGPDGRSDKLMYLVRVDVARMQQALGENDEASVLALSVKTVQGIIAGAFSNSFLTWDDSVAFEGQLPTYDPLYKMDGANVWILPVVTRNEAYFYLVG